MSLVQEVKLHRSYFVDCTFTCCSRSANTCAHALAKVGRKGTYKFSQSSFVTVPWLVVTLLSKNLDGVLMNEWTV